MYALKSLHHFQLQLELKLVFTTLNTTDRNISWFPYVIVGRILLNPTNPLNSENGRLPKTESRSSKECEL